MPTPDSDLQNAPAVPGAVRTRRTHLLLPVREFAATLSRHPEWLGWAALILALWLLTVRLGSVGDAPMGMWISADTLYPVNVFVDVFRDHYSISGWRFSIAPCWFPDLAVTGVFWGITRNPILATLLGGFIQIPAIVLCFHLIARALEIRMVGLQDTLLLAFGSVLTLYVAAHPDVLYPGFYEFFLPQTHVGSMVLVLGGWGMALWIVRERRKGRRVRLWLTIAYGTLCALAGMSNLLFFPHMLAPLTIALGLAIFFGLMTLGQCWLPMAVGWLAAAIGAELNRALFTVSDVSIQSTVGLEPATTAFDVFVHGFVRRLLAGDLLHVWAVLWVCVCIGNIVWFRRCLRASGISRMTDSQLLTAIFFTICLTSAVLSVAAIILGGSNGLVELKDYQWSMHYLHQTFLVPLFGLIVSAAWVCNKILNNKAANAVAWTVAVIVLVVTATRLIAAPPPVTPIYAYRPPLVRYLDENAQKENLHYGYAGYWQARLIALLSRAGVRAYAVDGSMNPYLWVSNSEWYSQSLEDRTRPPRISFVVLDYPKWKLTREAAVGVFGDPDEETQVNGTRILIYKRGAEVKVTAPLTSLSEDIQTAVKSLALRPGERTLVPVTLRNTGPSPWLPFGRNPITISYKWFDNGNVLPIEGERTLLPQALKPGDSTDVEVKVVAPDKAGNFVLKITLVEEGLAWFLTGDAKPLELPVTIQN